MRIKMMSGQLVRVRKVVPVVERMLTFNGDKKFLMEKAKSLRERPTALAIEIEQNENTNFQPAFNQEVIYGNFSHTRVCEILDALGQEGYFDFSKFDYQMADFFGKIKLDGGASKPYTSEITPCMWRFATGSLLANCCFSASSRFPIDITSRVPDVEYDVEEPEIDESDFDYDEEGDDE